MLGFGRKMAQAREEPLTGQNWAWGTQRDNFHVWAAPSPFLLPLLPVSFFVSETPFPGRVHDVAIKLHLTPEMEYCASAASMLVEEIWQIAEGFVEVLRNYVDSI